ncbi:MAG: Holliday junction resolvase RuvX [Clostridiales bacterium]|nr:Holliday junction resolvase RuvX [Clostridiales bacterium]
MKILAVDYGDARTGLAVCDRSELLASPVTVIHSRRMEQVLDETAAAAREQGAERIVVGNPLNMNGTRGPRSELCTEFAEKLRELTGLPVLLWDERSTTVSATQYLNATDTRGKKRKAVIDAVAATIILESYLAYRRNNPEE